MKSIVLYDGCIFTTAVTFHAPWVEISVTAAILGKGQQPCCSWQVKQEQHEKLRSHFCHTGTAQRDSFSTRRAAPRAQPKCSNSLRSRVRPSRTAEDHIKDSNHQYQLCAPCLTGCRQAAQGVRCSRNPLQRRRVVRRREHSPCSPFWKWPLRFPSV